jgi:hypothetical protein
MDQAAMEAKIAELEAKVKDGIKVPSFTDGLDIPEDVDAKGLKKILKDFEDHLQKKFKAEAPKAPAQRAPSNEDAEVAKFKEANPDLFDPKNTKHLKAMNVYYQDALAEGKTVAEALAIGYKELLENTKYQPPVSEEDKKKQELEEAEAKKKKEEEEQDTSSLFGTFDSSAKVDDKDLVTKGAKNEYDAVKSAAAELKAEGLSFPE